MSTIDLEIGEPDPDESPSARRRRERKADRTTATSEASRSRTSASSSREDNSLVGRLDGAFLKIADQLLARGDDELAEAIRDERRPMSQGLVSLTASITPLRPLLVLVLALMEPFLAFWRVGRILFNRFLQWRERRVGERQAAAEQWQREQEAAGVAVG